MQDFDKQVDEIMYGVEGASTIVATDGTRVDTLVMPASSHKASTSSPLRQGRMRHTLPRPPLYAPGLDSSESPSH